MEDPMPPQATPAEFESVEMCAFLQQRAAHDRVGGDAIASTLELVSKHASLSAKRLDLSVPYARLYADCPQRIPGRAWSPADDVDRKSFLNCLVPGALFEGWSSVTSLCLAGLTFPENIVPVEVFQLSQLKELDLSHCNLAHLPLQIGYLKNLETLALTGNQLFALPWTLVNCKNLQEIRIDQNRFGEVPGVLTLLPLKAIRRLGNPMHASLAQAIQTVNVESYVEVAAPAVKRSVASLQVMAASVAARNHLSELFSFRYFMEETIAQACENALICCGCQQLFYKHRNGVHSRLCYASAYLQNSGLVFRMECCSKECLKKAVKSLDQRIREQSRLSRHESSSVDGNHEVIAVKFQDSSSDESRAASGGCAFWRWTVPKPSKLFRKLFAH